jgi:acyl carrier protein
MSTVGGGGVAFMNREEIRDFLRESLSEIVDADIADLPDAATADEVAGWDSVNHIKLIFAIEARFGIAFEMAEMVAPDSVGALLDLIQSKIQAA